MKILIYSHEFPPFSGGAGTYSYDLASGLASLGVEVHVATPNFWKNAASTRVGMQPPGMHMHYMADWQTSNTMAHAFLLFLQLRRGFDLIVVTERRAQEIVATIRGRFFHYIAVVHGSEVLVYFGRKGLSLPVGQQDMLRFYERAELCIAGSNATLRLVKKLLEGSRTRLVPVLYGINLHRMALPVKEDTERLRELYGRHAEIIFCLGRLDLDKGQDVLIKAFRQVYRQRPQARLLIGGDGPNMVDLMRLRDTLGLADCIEFLGSVSQSDLPNYFELCDVFALPSKSEGRWEGFGLVYLEAGFYGKAVVGGNEGGVPEAISDNESGLVVNPRDENDVASAIVALLDDKVLRERMGAYGRKRILEYFNSERMAAETLGYIKQALSASGQRRFSSPGLGLIRWTLTELPSTFARWLVQKLRRGISRDR